MELHADLEEQIDRWRGYVQRRQAISSADVDELGDHLRGQIADRQASGLDDEEAFLVVIKRLGNLDSVSREFAREHSDRLWKQLVLLPERPDDTGAPPWRELAVVLLLAVGAGLAVKTGLAVLDDDGSVLARNVPLLVFPFLAAYFGWKRRLTAQAAMTVLVPFAALAVVLNVYRFAPGGSTELLAVLHTPVVLWLLAGAAYVGGQWHSDRRRAPPLLLARALADTVSARLRYVGRHRRRSLPTALRLPLTPVTNWPLPGIGDAPSAADNVTGDALIILNHAAGGRTSEQRGCARVSTAGQDLTSQQEGLMALEVDAENIHVNHGFTVDIITLSRAPK